ncbi:amidohydrolase [Paenibacillus psychroresistens]|uniref:Amidohydrolase n=1 Tax=Paenibacillus psychroresistens TaxID=1778678 RepID=A0A6B8RHA7_9BACL|nr:amidohydrolase family protein [Paenibacillus psychroresistens]QGQ95287.1 amidohydrolase [Paenibacillus psychroresistens]
MSSIRIDAHQHYWSLARNDYGWITPELPVLYRDFLPEDLAPHLQKHNLQGSIVVQAAATLAETEYLLGLSDTTDEILGVVGWLDLEDPNYREHFTAFNKHPKFVGFRVMIQGQPDANYILEPSFIEAMRFFAEKQVPVDLLLSSHQLDAVVKLLAEVPGLRAVIDHIAKPQIAAGIIEPWKSQMAAIAQFPGIYCKISAMATEADHNNWQFSDFTAYIHHVIDVFGKERIMFGSDWPVCLIAASYDDVINILLKSLPESWSETDNAKLFGENAVNFYQFKGGNK